MPARYMQPLRLLIQFCYLGFMVWLGVALFRFYLFLVSGGQAGSSFRPAAVEGFLPISGLMGTVDWIRSGSINTVHPAATVIFVCVLAGALLLRRSFCSWICPVATVSEYAWKAGFKLFRRTVRAPRWLDIPLRVVKYLLLAFFFVSIALVMSPDALQSFINADQHKLADIRLLSFFLQLSPLAMAILLALLLLSVVMRNPFCRYLCPYGALLGLLATLSPIRVTRSAERCVSCGVCSQVCPASIDVMHKATVASPECIGCWRCVSYCRFNQALSMRLAGRYVVPGMVFAVLVVLLLWGGTAIGRWNGHWDSALDIGQYRSLLGR